MARMPNLGPLCRLLLLAGILWQSPALAEEPSLAPNHTTEPERGGYVGSETCATCHFYIYETWQSTRHSYSVLSGEEAKEAGYPLPEARRGGEAPGIDSWDQVSYTIGGRLRITYADAGGNVLGTSFHHRTGRWDSFPQKHMIECGPCHFTGFGQGAPHPDNPALPSRWAERNIGCEACHGPGGHHSETMEKGDIAIDASSRPCGRCHTAAGRVLPLDNYHATHDLVQNWNDDLHVTGTQFNSHNALCSSCHSPYDGHFLEAAEGADKRVFAEAKKNITCIACHNPHDMTNPHYDRRQVSLSPPLGPKPQTYTGNDEDFSSDDFAEHATTEEVCLQCHRGADRIDLDHADATCGDCHNTFHRDTGPGIQVWHDANRPELSCRPCHRDGDHLLAVLFGDPVFLQPKYVHNLRQLPAAATAKYPVRYAGLAFPIGFEVPAAPSADAATEPGAPASPEQQPAAEDLGVPSPSRRLAAKAQVRRLVEEQPHAERGGAVIQALLQALADDPQNVGRYIDLARAYGRDGSQAAALDVLQVAMDIDPTRLLLLPQPATDRKAAADAADAAQARAAWLPPDLPASRAVRLWLQGYTGIEAGRFAEGAAAFDAAQKIVGDSARLGTYRGLAALRLGTYKEAEKTIRSVLDAAPDYTPARVALGAVYLERRNFAAARATLDSVLAAEPDNGVALYLLGQGYLNQRRPEEAAARFRAAAAVDSTFWQARYALARAYRLAGDFNGAAQVYQAIIARQPDPFDAHYQFASLMKLLSDQIYFQLQGSGEQAPPVGVDAGRWQAHLGQLRAKAAKFSQLALSQFALALEARPADPETVRQVSESYRRAGRLVEAGQYFEWLTQRQPDRWEHLYRLGTVRLQLGGYDAALDLLRRALELAPAEGDVYSALGLAHVRTGRLAQAIEVFERGTVHAPFNPALYTNLGAAYAGQGEYDKARAALERSLELATFPLPRLHLTHTNLALVHLARQRREEAVKALENALFIFPGYPYARRLLQELETENGPGAVNGKDYVFNDLLESFAEVTTVVFERE